MSKLEQETELKGGKVNYYLVRVEHPQREEQPPYTAECEDIGEALELTPNEMNVFKEIWRSANARKGNGKPGHQVLYGAQKIEHYAKRIHRRARINAQSGEFAQTCTDQIPAAEGWVTHTGNSMPPMLKVGKEIEIQTKNGKVHKTKPEFAMWEKRIDGAPFFQPILRWRHIP